jgi:hypothetical protein
MDWITFLSGLAMGILGSALVRGFIDEWREIEEASKWE